MLLGLVDLNADQAVDAIARTRRLASASRFCRWAGALGRRSPPERGDFGPNGIAFAGLGDIDGDGKPDLIQISCATPSMER
jgi:hypothetical protein